MNRRKTITNTEVAMMAGRRLSPRQIEAYKDALRYENDDGYIEVLMLLFAEAMADNHDKDDTVAVMTRLRDLQRAFTDEVEGGLTIDGLIVRVYAKTGLIFPMNPQEEAHIVGVLRDAGYDVETIGE